MNYSISKQLNIIKPIRILNDLPEITLNSSSHDRFVSAVHCLHFASIGLFILVHSATALPMVAPHRNWMELEYHMQCSIV